MRGFINTPRDIARELARRYSTMTHEELDMLEKILVPMKFARGEMILREGDICRNIYFVDQGLVRQFYFKNGKEVTEHQVEALEQSIVYAMPKKDLEVVALHSVNIQMMYRKILEESLIISQIHADLMRFETAQDRYMKMCKLYPQVVLRAPLVYIANYLQMTPETLSRVRAAAART